MQIVLESHGVKGYLEPEFPFLIVRLGVGANTQELTDCTRDPDVEVNMCVCVCVYQCGRSNVEAPR